MNVEQANIRRIIPAEKLVWDGFIGNAYYSIWQNSDGKLEIEKNGTIAKDQKIPRKIKRQILALYAAEKMGLPE